MTLQPPHPKPNGTDANLCKDLVVNSTGTLLNVLRGDIGTNTSATTTNSGEIRLADGYVIDHIDDISTGGCSYLTPNATWSQDGAGLPKGHLIGPAPVYPGPDLSAGEFHRCPGIANAEFQRGGGRDRIDWPRAPAVRVSDRCGHETSLTPPAGGSLGATTRGSTRANSASQQQGHRIPDAGRYRFDGGMKWAARWPAVSRRCWGCPRLPANDDP